MIHSKLKFCRLTVFACVIATWLVANSQTVACTPQNRTTGKKLTIKVNVDSVQPDSTYWIGVDCCAVSPILRSQMRLQYGLAILELAEPSPASEAGLKPYDILVRMNSQPLNDRDQLASLVSQSAGNTVFVELLREGEPMRLPIRPERRPSCETCPIVLVADKDGNFDLDQASYEIADLINDREEGQALQNFELIFVKPTIVFRSDKEAVRSNLQLFGKTHQMSASELEHWDNAESTEIEWIRLEADMQQNLAMIRGLEIRMGLEQQRFDSIIKRTLRQQANTVRLIEAELKQVGRRTDHQTFTDLIQHRNEVEESILKWEQVANRLSCYRSSLDCNSYGGAEKQKCEK